MISRRSVSWCAGSAERRRLAGCAVAAALLCGGEATAQSDEAGDACVLAAARIDPVAFARAQLRYPQGLQGCRLDPAGEAPRDRAAAIRPPSSVRIDPPPVDPAGVARQTPEVPPTPTGPASVAPAGSVPAANRSGAAGLGPAAQGSTWSERMRRLELQVEAVALRNDIDPLLLHALIHVESRHRPDAVSPAGARGAMQLMPQTAARFGVHTPRHVHDPDFNLAAGAAYLKMLQAEFGGDLDLALAAYNAGEGAVRRYGGRIPPFPETQAYVREVRAVHQRLRAESGRDANAPTAGAQARLAMSERTP